MRASLNVLQNDTVLVGFWYFQCSLWQILCDLKTLDRNSPQCFKGSACTVMHFICLTIPWKTVQQESNLLVVQTNFPTFSVTNSLLYRQQLAVFVISWSFLFLSHCFCFPLMKQLTCLVSLVAEGLWIGWPGLWAGPPRKQLSSSSTWL